MRAHALYTFQRQVRKARKGGPTAVLEVQKKNLRKLLRHAYENVPFYRRLYGNCDIDSIELADLPSVTKPQLMNEFSDTLSERGISLEEVKAFVSGADTIGQLFKGRYIVLYTSGSTGERGYFISDIVSWQRAQTLGYMRFKPPLPYLISATPFFRLRVALVIVTGGHFASSLFFKINAPIMRYFFKIFEIDLLTPEEEIIARLNKIKPHHIHTYPTFLQALVENQEEGRLTFKPTALSVSSEPFLPSLRARVHKNFDPIMISELYGTTEILHIAQSCPLGRMHLAADWVIVEPVTEAGAPVPPGELGKKVFVTNLFNYSQPLIRYEMTDAVRIDHVPCECSSPLPVIELFGRTNDILTIISPEGKKVHLFPSIIWGAFLGIPNLKNYQIIHEKQNHLFIRYIPDYEGKEREIESAIVELFKNNLKHYGIKTGVEIVTQRVTEIARDPVSRKIKQIIDMTSE